jgi:proline utilization trans-activator
MPTLDYAIYLINAVTFHLGQLYHIFDESTFESRPKESYAASSEDCGDKRSIWLVQLLVFLVFVKAFLSRKPTNAKPPGARYFESAFRPYCLRFGFATTRAQNDLFHRVSLTLSAWKNSSLARV